MIPLLRVEAGAPPFRSGWIPLTPETTAFEVEETGSALIEGAPLGEQVLRPGAKANCGRQAALRTSVLRGYPIPGHPISLSYSRATLQTGPPFRERQPNTRPLLHATIDPPSSGYVGRAQGVYTHLAGEGEGQRPATTPPHVAVWCRPQFDWETSPNLIAKGGCIQVDLYRPHQFLRVATEWLRACLFFSVLIQCTNSLPLRP